MGFPGREVENGGKSIFPMEKQTALTNSAMRYRAGL